MGRERQTISQKPLPRPPLPEAKKDSAVNMLAWLENTPNAEENTRFWDRAVSVLTEIEKNIDKAMIVK